MFSKTVYSRRRRQLMNRMSGGLILFIGNDESPMNYSANPYHFRQDSSFLYYFGIDKPGFTGLIDIDERVDFLFGSDLSIDDVIWMGPQPSVSELARTAGVKQDGQMERLVALVEQAVTQGRPVHFLPAYRAETMRSLSRLTGIRDDRLNAYASRELIGAVVEQRSVKSDREVAEIETALAISHDMVAAARRTALPGKYEYEVAGAMEGVVRFHGAHISFPTICSIHGETLHNHYHGNRLSKGDLLVIDSGAESPEYYASDITRTLPVGGAFQPRQKEIYRIVLNAQLAAIKAMKPGRKFRDIHIKAARAMASGLKDLGLMKGDVETAVRQGAHALFFPHGLGHMLGLDVHDMENLGEDFVGYDSRTRRSDQFGLAYLRLARRLEPGFVVTVEPGLYFIPALIDQWRSQKKHAEFINYDRVRSYREFGGIRIEDDVLVTDKGSRVLGQPIPKGIQELEA